MAVQISTLTYGEAIRFISRMVGHPVPTDAAGSPDPAVQQMGTAVNIGLGELLTMHEWQDLTVRASIPVSADFAGQKEKGFTLPDDFYRMIDQSEWSDSSMLPALGPVSNQAWQAYVVRNYAMQMSLYWQMRQDQIWFLNPPFPGPASFEYMYLSKAQVIDGVTPTLYKNIADQNSDKFLLDGYMIMLLGRAKYLEWKGFDASAAMRDFLVAYNSRAGSDRGAPLLSLGRRPGYPLVNPATSVPDTGYGA